MWAARRFRSGWDTRWPVGWKFTKPMLWQLTQKARSFYKCRIVFPLVKRSSFSERWPEQEFVRSRDQKFDNNRKLFVDEGSAVLLDTGQVVAKSNDEVLNLKTLKYYNKFVRPLTHKLIHPACFRTEMKSLLYWHTRKRILKGKLVNLVPATLLGHLRTHW